MITTFRYCDTHRVNVRRRSSLPTPECYRKAGLSYGVVSQSPKNHNHKLSTVCILHEAIKYIKSILPYTAYIFMLLEKYNCQVI